MGHRLMRVIWKSLDWEYPSVPHRPPQFNTSVPHKDHTFSAPEIPQFNTPLSSTPKTPFGVEVRDFGW